METPEILEDTNGTTTMTGALPETLTLTKKKKTLIPDTVMLCIPLN